ncbi:MAG: hypothetical protein MPK06_08175 [Alphaproteobacteria bacterium]|nr:hypothetical protein [Alphaproteobacteria bacterium]MDA7983456.1 hypothetical protein [Alphaproteobacteria bacterium]MDA7984817.1 hypothetical protein [Alphaproteobacteria bacterium]MDA7987633.1 hypothetical protein [Alphaproteobacteria bacterium]MDA7988588.1 hypothetical protein [Alphaproteobacteria bacterium]
MPGHSNRWSRLQKPARWLAAFIVACAILAALTVAVAVYEIMLWRPSP